MLRRSAVIIVLGFLAFASVLKSPFKTMDDRISIVQNPLIRSTQYIPVIFREGYFHDQYYYRPLINLSFMAEYHAFGLNSFFYNCDNLILHLLNALLVFLLVTRLTGNEMIGFWVGLLFVIHPLQWEAVCNISGRTILMSAFFILSTFILFLEFYKNRQWPYLLGAAITFFLGLLCKESTGVFPAVLISYLFLDRNRPWRDKFLPLIPFAVMIAGYLLLRHAMGIVKVFHADNMLMTVLSFLTFLRSVITDLRLFLFPIDLHFDRCAFLFRSLTDIPAMLTIIFWLAAGFVLYFYRRQISSFGWFLIVWFAWELFPVSQLVSGIGVGSGRISTAEHFLYTASIPVLTGIVIFFRWCYERNIKSNFMKPVLLKLVAGGFLIFLFMTAVEQSIYASNEFSMLNRSLMFEPNNPRIQGAMGMLSIYRNDLPDAEAHFRAATKAEPFNPQYHIDLGTALFQEGRWIEALEQYVAFDPGIQKPLVDRQAATTISHIQEQLAQGKIFDARGWLAIGIYQANTGNNTEAVSAFLKTISLNPHQTDAWFNLASIEETHGQREKAEADYQKLLGLAEITPLQKKLALQHLSALEAP